MFFVPLGNDLTVIKPPPDGCQPRKFLLIVLLRDKPGCMIKEDLIKVTDFLPLVVSSTAFIHGKPIPKKYTCEGEDILPALDVAGIPTEAKSLALIIDDPDAPGKTWVHYVAWNLPLDTHVTANNLICTEGLNDFNKHSYGGPCPPSGTHRYFFKIYALDTLLSLREDSRKGELEKAMATHILAFGELMGTYRR